MQRKIVVTVDMNVCAAANATKTIVMVISTDSYHTLAFFFQQPMHTIVYPYKPFSFFFFSICILLIPFNLSNIQHFTFYDFFHIVLYYGLFVGLLPIEY